MSRLGPDELRQLSAAHLGRLLLQALRRVETTAVAKLNGRGHRAVRTGHILVFSAIDSEGTRITDLAARAGVTRQMMGRLVHELEAAGYVGIRTHPNDQRVQVIMLTEAGWSFCSDAQEVAAEMETGYDNLLGMGGLTGLREALLRLIEAG